MERLDDEALVGALHHELEHVRGRDPLRYAVAGWALSVNPWGRFLLEHELDEWLLGRELYCDREAVRKGASAPAIAHAIVTAARPMAPPPMAALGTTSFEALKLRVQVLLAYAEQPPQPSRKQPGFAAAVLAMIALALLPHAGATGVLDAVHVIAERTLMLVSN
jgi:beta-lactamase regulating signal transducer with metallopeptidase domain